MANHLNQDVAEGCIVISVIEIQRDRIAAACARRGVLRLDAFGSAVRGDYRPSDSDIDFLVDFQPGSTLFDQVGLIEELSSKLGRKVDVVSARALNRHLSQKILQESMTL